MKYIVKKFWDGYICEVRGYLNSNDKIMFFGLSREQALDFALRWTYKETQKDVLVNIIKHKKNEKKMS